MFATAMLAVVSDIAMDLVENISGALFVSDLFTNLLGSAALSGNTAGIMQASMQQLGLGLILSTLLITTPAMAANFFNGVMGAYNAQNPLGGFGVAAKAPTQNGANGQNGVNGQNGMSPTPSIHSNSQGSNTTMPSPSQVYIPSNNASVNKDVIKTSSDVGNASRGFAHNEVVQSDRAIKDPSPPTKIDKV
jgi:type IV secretion system protein VirB6